MNVKGVKMPLRKAKGNMFDFITHTWNPIKGICSHDCAYCYMKKWGPLKNQPHFDKREYNFDLGENNFIFIGSSIDIFAESIKSEFGPNDWLANIFCRANFYKNKYLLQTKNPARYLRRINDFNPSKFVLSTTIETNYFIPEIMNQCPPPIERAAAMAKLPKEYKRMVTIEPIMKFNLDRLVEMIMLISPVQINIGADSLNHQLPEPEPAEILNLIGVLEKLDTTVKIKPNLKRILNP
jgi:DNA repair photolyase